MVMNCPLCDRSYRDPTRYNYLMTQYFQVEHDPSGYFYTSNYYSQSSLVCQIDDALSKIIGSTLGNVTIGPCLGIYL